MLGLTFKLNTDVMRQIPSLAIIMPSLGIVDASRRAEARTRAHGPERLGQAKLKLIDVGYADTARASAESADAVVLIAEWNAYRNLDLHRLREVVREPVLVDLRNVCCAEEMAPQIICYYCVGGLS